MGKDLTWRHLKALNQLYKDKRTDAKITDNGYIANILIAQMKLIKAKPGNAKVLEANSRYFPFYEANFKTDFEKYSQFLQVADLEDDARRRYTEDDIKTLMFIRESSNQLIQSLTTIRTFSSEVFKSHGSKYLENKPGLKKAVCTLLGIDDFPDKDPKNHQWRLTIDCVNPTAIILCENIAHLKNSWRTREANIELWYVGGNNIGIIDFISSDKLTLPIYYSCDWDFAGLSIFSRIKAKMKQKQVDIKLLHPHTYETVLPVNSDFHESRWNFNLPLSGLPEEDFSPRDVILIKKLIKDDKWIEEESLDILVLHRSNTSG